ncbi:MAG: STAS domain-containing protein [Ignavibacteriaceae bacterium]|nr:STAS domain-containing protein [Ignavibacteriaceae bacterium]
MGFLQEEHGSIIVEIVDLKKATLIHAEAFKLLLFDDIKSGWKNIIIDLSECEFIDSTFLGAIVMGLKKVTQIGGNLCLAGVQPEVKNMFQLTRMNKIFNIFDAREDALASFT